MYEKYVRVERTQPPIIPDHCSCDLYCVGQKTITSNGEYNAVNDGLQGYSKVSVNVSGSITPDDEGKVVQGGALVSQTTRNVNSNGTYDTTTNNSTVVNVPNSYTAGDEGKVVSGGALVAQSSQTVTQNNTYDTTLINSMTVNLPDANGNTF